MQEREKIERLLSGLYHAAEGASKLTLEQILKNSTPYNFWDALLRRYEHFMAIKTTIMHGKLPRELVIQILNLNIPMVKIWLSKRDDLPPDIMKALAEDPDPSVQDAITPKVRLHHLFDEILAN